MKLKINEMIALILIATGIFDLYVIPKVIEKSPLGQNREQKEKILKIIRIVSYATIGLGIFFLLNLIPISGD